MGVLVTLLLGALLVGACGSSPSPTLPGVSMTADDGWSREPLGERSIRLSRAAGDDEVLVTLAFVDAESAADAAQHVGSLEGLTILASSDSRMSGRTGPNRELENTSTARIGILTSASGELALEPGERMWLSLFDTAEGVLAIAVTSDAAAWDAALLVAEPLLESVTIDG
jgi:hypothetical protein